MEDAEERPTPLHPADRRNKAPGRPGSSSGSERTGQQSGRPVAEHPPRGPLARWSSRPLERPGSAPVPAFQVISSGLSEASSSSSSLRIPWLALPSDPGTEHLFIVWNTSLCKQEDFLKQNYIFSLISRQVSLTTICPHFLSCP